MQRFLQTSALYLLCAGLAYSNDLDTLRQINAYNNIDAQEQLVSESPLFQLLITDPPDSGTSGYFAVNIALQSLLSGEPIPAYVQRELEAAAADIERRAKKE